MKKYARLRPSSSSSNSEKFEEIDNVLYNSRPEESHMKMNHHHHTSNTCSSSLQHQDSPVVVVAPSSSSSLSSRVPPFPSSTTGPSHTDLAEALKKLASFREGGGSTRWQQQQQRGNGLNGNGLNGDGESIHSRSVSGRWPGSGEGGWGAPQDVSGSGRWGRWGTADSGSLSGRWGSTSTNDQWDEPAGHPHQSSSSSSYRDTTLSLSQSGRLLQDQQQQQQQQQGESAWSTGLNFLARRNSAKKSSSFRESSNLGQGRNNIINMMATGTTTSTSNSSSSAHHFGGDLGSGGGGLQPHHLAGAESVQQRKKNNINNNINNNNNISMRETQGWLATVQRPQPLRSSGTHLASSVPAARISPPNGSRLWEEDPNEFNWKLASTPSSSTQPSKKAVARTTASQSMRYDRLKATDFAAGFDDEDEEARWGCGASGGFHRNDPLSTTNVMQKAASMREGGAHSDAIMAMARAYSEKHHGGIPPAILECVSCGRGLGVVIVQGNPGIADTSFCQSCRPLPGLSWSYASSKVLEVSKSKRKGMMHYCRKILRIGKKPNILKFSL